MKMGVAFSARQRQRAAEQAAISARCRIDLRARATRVTCAARTCGEPVERGQIFCKPHWFSLPRPLRGAIWTTFRHRLAGEYGALVAKARAIIDGESRA